VVKTTQTKDGGMNYDYRNDFNADICIFESVFTDSLGKPADDRALLRKLEWMDKVGMHNMKGIMEYLKDNKK
jgi:hypothetical protein